MHNLLSSSFRRGDRTSIKWSSSFKGTELTTTRSSYIDIPTEMDDVSLSLVPEEEEDTLPDDQLHQSTSSGRARILSEALNTSISNFSAGLRRSMSVPSLASNRSTRSIISLASRSRSTRNLKGGHQLDVVDQTQARAKVESFFANSALPAPSIPIPCFESDEVIPGRFLGRGGFSDVEEVRGFYKPDSIPRRSPSRRQLSSREDAAVDHESRAFIMEHAFRSCGNSRYAVKRIQRSNRSTKEKAISAMLDLHIEAKFLQSLIHPNIIKLRATCRYEYTLDYFLILDRLFGTLQKRIQNWSNEKRKLGRESMLKKLFCIDRAQSKKTDFLLMRLVAAYDLAEAISYMHECGIIHRDIKPENIGFDIRDDIKIFDLGLARELRDDERLDDGTYHLSKNGSLRYMAPEVILGHPYNDRADVYSFSVVLWEMIALQRPYTASNKSERQHKEQVCLNHHRPLVKDTWSPSLQSILRHGWDEQVHERYSMEKVKELLRKEVIRLRGGDDSGLGNNRRRSTFVFEGSNNEEIWREIALHARNYSSIRSLHSS